MSQRPPVVDRLSRDAILLLLNSLGAELPLDTKLADEELKKRLHLVIDAIQRFHEVIPSPPLNPTSLPIWQSAPDENLGRSMVKRSIEEAVLSGDSSFAGSPSYTVRMGLYTMANGLEKVPRMSKWLFRDRKTSVVIIRLLGVHRLPDSTPVIPVLYLHKMLIGDDKVQFAQDWLKQYEDDAATIPAGYEVQQLLLLILERNAKALSKEYKPPRGLFESDFSLSFFVPLSPLSRADIARFGQNNPCDVCGKTAKSLCSKCAVARYCSRDCQKKDWPEHKKMCQSLTGAKWKKFNMLTPSEGLQRISGQTGLNHVSFLNRHDTDFDGNGKEGQSTAKTIFPNAHGSKPFIIKVQLGMALLVYDRLRTFQCYLTSEGNEEAFPVLKRLVENGPLYGKAYCWARRTENERDLLIVVDRLPDQSISW